MDNKTSYSEIEKEFTAFESKIIQSKELENSLNLIDIERYKDEIRTIVRKLLDINRIDEAEKMIERLKQKIKKDEAISRLRVSLLTDKIFDCSCNLYRLNYSQLIDEYTLFYKEYSKLSDEEKIIVRDIILKLYKNIESKKNEMKMQKGSQSS